MAKRVGANNRKKNAVRRTKRKRVIRKTASRTFIASVITGAAAVLFYFGYDKITDLKSKFEDSALLSVKNILVKGTVNIPEEKVLEMSGIVPGMKIFRINGKNIDTLLGCNPWVESVKLVKNLKGFIRLEVVERKPVALVNLGDIVQTDIHGIILPLTTGATTPLPLVSGLKDTVDNRGRQVIKADDLKRLKTFLKNLKETDESLMTRVSQIDLSDQEKVRITFQSSPTLFELDAASAALRLNHLKRLEEVIQDMAQLPGRVNLCYQNLAFVTQPVSVKTEVIQAVSD